LKYSKQAWLNIKGSPSTGAVVAYHGPSPWSEDTDKTFLEVSDCHYKVRLHKTDVESMRNFIRKLRKLAKIAEDFATWLELRERDNL